MALELSPDEQARENARRYWANKIVKAEAAKPGEGPGMSEGRNIADAAECLIGSSYEQLELIAKRDPSMIIDVAAAYLAITMTILDPTGAILGCGAIECVNECGGDYTWATCPHAKPTLQSDLAKYKQAVAVARQGLEDVLNPVGHLRRHADAVGRKLGGNAYSVAHDLGFVQSIARDALASLDLKENEG